MSRCCNPGRLALKITPLFLAFSLVSCGYHRESSDQIQVRQTFASWQADVLNSRMNQSMAYIPKNVYDYFQVLNSGTKTPVVAPALAPVVTQSPGVDLLLRTALDKKVAPNVRPTLTLDSLIQRITNKRLFKPRDVGQIRLGYVAVNGTHASADIYYQGTLTALRMPFLKQDGAWKIDVLAILPYVEVLMRVDRAIKGETQNQQVERLVSNMPVL
jgi:hypothetical protein